MATPEADRRSPERRAKDEHIATEPQMAPLRGDERNGSESSFLHFQAVIENVARVKITSRSAVRTSPATRSLAIGVRGKMSPYPTVANVTVEKYMD